MSLKRKTYSKKTYSKKTYSKKTYNKKICNEKICNRTAALLIVIAAAITVGVIGKDSVSAAESRFTFTPRSYGRFIYDDQDASNNSGREHDLLIDAADFADIAENIGSLNGITDELAETTVRKNDVMNTLEEIKENADADKVVGANALKELMQAFQDGVNKIYDKLAGLGFTPKTNSPDDMNHAIQDIYDSRYAQGYSDGLSQTQPMNGKITYTYHQHTGSPDSGGGCYTVLRTSTQNVGCPGEIICSGGPYGPDTSGKQYWAGTCPECLAGDNSYTMNAKIPCPNRRYETYTYYDLGCGMSTNTIISAVIEFE